MSEPRLQATDDHAVSEFRCHDLPMISGRADAEARRFKKIPCTNGRGGVWLVALQPNEADNVYFHDPRDTKSDGFGGATLRFTLEDGTVYEAKGPWKGHAGSLLRDTGYDCRDKHLTFVAIGRAQRFEKNPRSYMGSTRILSDLAHRDPDGGAIGDFYRYKQILAKLPNGEYFYYSESAGGSSAGPQTVDDWWREQINAGNFNPDRPRGGAPCLTVI